MAAPSGNNPDGTVTKTPEYNDFISRLQQFHLARGTPFDPEPRVGVKHLNLHYLYKIVLSRGGYDKVSDEKLAWRKLGTDLQLGMSNLPAQAFTLKSQYYKLLAAFEIKDHWGKEPPPKEILEETTAKGGNLLTRTLDNFKGNRRDTGGNGSDSEGTPGREHGTNEDTPGSGGRSTRGLRQAPPQRVLFQPDTLPARQARQLQPPSVSAPLQRQGASSYNVPSNSEMSQVVANYEPRPQVPMALRPVVTPGNNPVDFARRQKAQQEQQAIAAGQRVQVAPRIMLPGTGFEGPNIYMRCLLALKSGIPSEQDYALHHLVKISMERGDKYRFESFSGLAEALIDKCLDISSLFYDIEWEVSYLDNGSMPSTYSLDGLTGTTDILERIANLLRKDVDDSIQTEEFRDKLLLINQAALTLRNMVMLEENAAFVSKLFPLRDFLSIALNLPNFETVVELKHYALDIAEQLTKYLVLPAIDPLYLSLVAQLDTEDRGAILTSLRAISRISMNLEEQNYLSNIPIRIIQKIFDWTLLDDDELVLPCLDFFYQYTATIPNVDTLVTELPLQSLISQLVRLLSHGSIEVPKEFMLRNPVHVPGPLEIPPIPADLLTQLLALEEPRRSSQWLRSLFEEDKDESITQIALWQAYQSRFASTVQETGHPLLAAAEFIKNVSTTFAEKAAAQVEPGPVQKFIIKGIRIREIPVDFNGKEYDRCGWKMGGVECGHFFMGHQSMISHILTDHCGIQKNEAGSYDNVVKDFTCNWKSCERYPEPTNMQLSRFASHIKRHLPYIPPSNETPSTNGVSNSSTSTTATADITKSAAPPTQKSWLKPAEVRTWRFKQGPVDERGEASGIPLSAVLVLRNLARNLPKTEAEEILREDAIREARDAGNDNDEEVDYIGYREILFKPVESTLWTIFSENRSLGPYLADLLPMISGSLPKA